MAILSAFDQLSLVPPRRFGQVLTTARESAGLTTLDMCERAGGLYTVDQLEAFERGAATITDADIAQLTDMYEVARGGFTSERSELIIDLAEGFIASGDEAVAVESERFAKPDPEDVLGRYLSLIYTLRTLPPGTPIPLRVDDIATLADALQLSGDEVELRLSTLMRNRDDALGLRARLLRKEMMVPSAGVLVGTVSTGSLVLVQPA